MKTDLFHRLVQKLQPERERILIVDDEEHLRMIYSKFFEQRGYRVTTASSLAEEEVKLRAESFDLILHDVMLEDGDGIEFLPTIKLIQPAVPVIILTAIGYDEEAMDEARRNGASSFVSKLSPLDQVLVEVHRVLKAAATGGSQASGESPNK
jgi:DNA-binding NtrC family response regulator